YIPQVILAGRRINDGMGVYIAQKAIKLMVRAGVPMDNCQVTILGLAFKENCRDIRNSRVVDIIRELQDYGVDVRVCDPLVDPELALEEYGIKLSPFDDIPPADALIIAVAHNEFQHLDVENISKLIK